MSCSCHSISHVICSYAFFWITPKYHDSNLVTICTYLWKNCVWNSIELDWNRFVALKLQCIWAQSVFSAGYYTKPEKLGYERKTLQKWKKRPASSCRLYIKNPQVSLCILAFKSLSFERIFRRFAIRITMENEQINFCK